MKKRANALWALLIGVAAAVALLILFLMSKGNAPALGIDRSEQQDVIPLFFAELRDGDYDAAMDYVSNYESLGFERDSSELINTYRQKLIESYSVTVLDADVGESSGLTAVQEIELTFLDSRLLLAAINEKTAVTVNEFLYYGGKIESDEQALDFVYSALNECMETPELYYSTEQLTVLTEYDGEKWQIIIDDAFLNALHGYIGNTASEGNS